MLNQVTLIGRLTHDPVVKTIDEGKKVSDIQIAVQRAFKNMEGLYETDFISCSLWQGSAEIIENYCKKGSMIAIRGRLQTKKVELSNEKTVSFLELVGERVIHLSSTFKNAPSCPEEDA
ncbi:single-strand DNA-binding protein [Acholeplasma morum]|jgi:single-strand DNA-binding protein|uniref:single-stranded DNA-binding protein n=1 Tax=Paracholeplasma morum TaxID=264637 RepID=UPI0019571412|nr:single-stranded DNA-binding protein [Paracholeplasma morum]MBM7453590.1 single-strand DNA-binding protein [Paracholeplasma morum]